MTSRTTCAAPACPRPNTYRVTIAGGTRLVRGAGGRHDGTWCRQHAAARVADLDARDEAGR
jgi:hypothetical protein